MLNGLVIFSVQTLFDLESISFWYLTFYQDARHCLCIASFIQQLNTTESSWTEKLRQSNLCILYILSEGRDTQGLKSEVPLLGYKST